MTRKGRGSTLLELLVALAVMGVALGVAAVAFRPEPEPDAATRAVERVAAYRRQALAARRPIQFRLPEDSIPVEGTAYPDGRVLLADSALVEPMSGRGRAQ